ncbi:hypothetical protein SCACP_38580 [Sporomusa carbonis]|uniref:hypothetical protein n=1 Tax=Sporomusa carbonis TaxID=3076075 RepID=UPI003A6076DF
MDFNQILVALGFKPITYKTKALKVDAPNKLLAGMQRIKEKQEKFNKYVLKNRKPQTFLSGQWAYSQLHTVNRVKALEDKQDVYFTPNRLSGRHRSEDEVQSCDNFSIDLDAGKDEHGNYLPIEVVELRKIDMLKMIKTLPQYTALVQTRNGYHVHWSIKEGANIILSEWKKIQAYIVDKTGADPQVKDGARLMKLPYTFAMKGGAYDPYLVNIVEVNEVEYDPQELLKLFEEWEGEVAPTNITIPTVRKNTTVPTIGAQAGVESYTDNIAAIKELDHRYFNSLFKQQMQRMTRKEAMKYFLQSKVNLSSFLGLPERFSCIFHNDKNPSAVIMAPRGAHTRWTYLCHSSNCSLNAPMDIIDVVVRIAGVNFNRAIMFLAACFNISIPGKRGRHINDIIKGNITAVQTIMDESKAYKRKLQPIMNAYTALLEIARTSANMTDTQYYGTDVYFSASKRFLAKQIGTNDEGSTYRKTVLLAALGLVEKVADNDLPESIKQRDYLYKRDLEMYYGGDRTIQYYRIKAIDSLKEMQIIKKQLDK